MASTPTKSSPVQGGQGSRGSLIGGMQGDAVSMDRLWRNRITQELQFQRSWKEEFNFLSPNKQHEQLKLQLQLQEEQDKKARGGGGGDESDGAQAESRHAQRGADAAATTHSARLTATLLNAQTSVGSVGCVNISDITASDLADLQKELQRAQYMSTQQASYKFASDKLLELSAGSHRKLKFRV